MKSTDAPVDRLLVPEHVKLFPLFPTVAVSLFPLLVWVTEFAAKAGSAITTTVAIARASPAPKWVRRISMRPMVTPFIITDMGYERTPRLLSTSFP
jgi:hypothetical protein